MMINKTRNLLKNQQQCQWQQISTNDIHTLTFLGENTPTVSPSSLKATPISANTASLKEKKYIKYFYTHIKYFYTSVICVVKFMHN